MNPWQQSIIRGNICNLQENTVCNSLFRAVLKERSILGDNDISELDAVKKLSGRHAETELLYSLLLTREGAFGALIDACKETKQTGTLRILKQGHLEHISHSTTWDELSEDAKNEIGSKPVNFQGKTVKLSECCNRLHPIEGAFLKEVVKGNAPTLVNNHVPGQLEHYITRTLQGRNRLKYSVFQQACNDVFVVKGMEEHQLTNLAAGSETDVSGNQINDLTVRFILLKNEGDFEDICKLSSSPVHLINYKDNIYEWLKSSGSVKHLQQYVDDDQKCFLEEKLLSTGNRVTVIPDSAGMGKTVLLENIAHQISKEKPNILIRVIVMKDMVQALHRKPIHLESILSWIAEKSSEFDCGRDIVKHKLKSEPCILMFDEFDEVLFNQVETAKEILTTIVTLKSAQIFITTRPHMQEELENTLHVLGYTINPFTQADQENFLVKFWHMHGAKLNENLEQFSKSCVKLINFNITDIGRQIAGIPLQCRLLAEIYTDQAVRCSGMKICDSEKIPTVKIDSIFEMYERHVKMRLQKSCKNSIIKAFAFCLLHGKSQVEALKNVHMYYALELSFPEFFREHAHQLKALKTFSFSLDELCAPGLLEATNSENIRFVHQTFAEFFLAWFAVETKVFDWNLSFLLNELLATNSEEQFIVTPLGKTVLGTSFTFKYPGVAYFINGFTKMYAKNRGNQEQTHRVSKVMYSDIYKVVSRIFIASAVSDYQFVPLAVSLCYEPSLLIPNEDSDICELLLISAKYAGVGPMKIFCSERDLINLKLQSKFESFLLTPLHVAVQRGHYHLVELLAQKYESELNNTLYLFHFCVFDSMTNEPEIIRDKVQIIKLLHQKSSVYINERFSDGTVPLLQKNVHNDLLLCLIEYGADVNVLDKNGNTILNKITENPVTPEFYHRLVDLLIDRKFKHFNHLNWKKVTPLYCVLEH